MGIISIDAKISLINSLLCSEFEKINTIIPIEYFNKEEWYFAGGCIYSLWNNKEPKDYDLFCKNTKAINRLRKWFRKNKERANFISKNAITMDKYQFVTKYVGMPDIEVGKFDFKHNMFYFENDSLHNLVDWSYLDSNKLEFNSERARNILNILTRIPKFVEREMTISQKEILEILEMGTRPTKIFSERRKIKQTIKGKSGY